MRLFPWRQRKPFNGQSRRRVLFARPPADPIDLVKPPSYEPPDDWQDRARSDVEQLIESLKPNAIDAGSREVLNNFINALVDQAWADVTAARDDRQAIARVLIGMSDEELSRHVPRYNADSAYVSHTSAALAGAFETLTGRKASEFVAAGPSRLSNGPLHSSIGAVELHLNNPTVRPDDDQSAVASPIGEGASAVTLNGPELDPDGGEHSNGRH